MPGPSEFPSDFPVPPLQVAPEVEVRPDGTWSDPEWAEDGVVVRVHRVEDALILDLFFNRFRSSCDAPTRTEQKKPVQPEQKRERALGDGNCVSEVLHEVRTYEKSYCEVVGGWERWVLPADDSAVLATLAPLGEEPAPDPEHLPAGMGRVVSIQAAAGAGALDTSTHISSGDAAADFYQTTESVVSGLGGRKVAEGWNPVGFWYQTIESPTVPPRQVWETQGEPHPCPPERKRLTPPGVAILVALLLLGGVLGFCFRPGAAPSDAGAGTTTTTEATATTVEATATTARVCIEVAPAGDPGTYVAVVGAEPGLFAPEVAPDGDPADGLQVGAGFVAEGHGDLSGAYLVQYHFPEGSPMAGGEPAWVGGEVDPQLADGHVDGPDIKVEGRETPPHLDLNPVVIPDPLRVLEDRGLDPATPHSVLVIMEPAAFVDAIEASIWHNHTGGFNHYPQAVSGPPDPMPVFDPSLFGSGRWVAAAINDGSISLSSDTDHLLAAVVLVFAPHLFNCG